MNLFPNEEYLVRSNNDNIILTTHRIQLTSKEWGSSYRNILFLEDISSIEKRSSSWVLALVLGIVLLLGGFMWASQNDANQLNVVTIAGAVAVIVYFMSRRHIVSITPNGGKSLNFEAGQMGDEQMNEFLDKVQLAKLSRIKNSIK